MKDKLARNMFNMLEQRTNQIELALRDMKINEIIDKSARSQVEELENRLSLLVDYLGLKFKEVKEHVEIVAKEEQK